MKNLILHDSAVSPEFTHNPIKCPGGRQPRVVEANGNNFSNLPSQIASVMDNQEPPSKIVLYHLQLSFMAHQNSTPTSFPQVEGALEHARQEKEKLGRIQRDNLHMAYVFDDFVYFCMVV